MKNLLKKAFLKCKNVVTVFAVAAVSLLPKLVAAQTQLLDINGGLTSATTTISGTYDLVSKLCLAVGGIVGLIGGIRVYIMWNQKNKDDITKEIVGWGGSCLFLLLTGTLLNVFFT